MEAPEDPPATLLPAGDDVDTATGSGSRSPLLRARATDPTRIGRFLVLRLLGQGGMGRVYAAFDERLDRRVAIKLLRPFRHGLDQAGRARVVREAQAMAKLSHPNVVQVFEVGEHEDELFVAMEFVRGVTLDAWQSVPGRRFTDVLQAYRQAGEGLVAAHAAGLVHRDFKPQNAMVEDDGTHMRVRVLDFGLARRRGEATPLDTSGAGGHSGSADKLTMTGSVLGTPAYMAPEQFSTASVGEAADQFSFCVSLWEGLYGARPFGATTGYSLVEAVLRARVREPPADSAVPGWVRHAVTRGLAAAPEDRWPSMRALLDALARDPAERRRMWLQRGAAVVLVGAGTAGALTLFDTDSLQCTGAEQQLAGVWDPARRSEVEAAILGTKLAYAADAWRTAGAGLDAFASAWTEMHTEACLATTVRGEQSVEVMDLRMACLQRARGQLRAVADVLADPDPGVVQNAHAVVAELPSLSHCADVDALRADDDPPREEDAEAVESARALLADAETQTIAGRPRDAEASLAEASQILADVDYPPVQIDLDLAQAAELAQAGRDAEAEAALTRALELATKRFHRGSMQIAATRLLHLVGVQAKRTNEAQQRYRMLAEVLAAGDPNREALVHRALGNVLETEGKYADAEGEFRKALVLREDLADSAPTSLAQVRNDLGGVLMKLGRYADAEVEFRRAAEVFEEVLGASHPVLAMARANTSWSLSMQGKYAEAEEEAKAALAIRERALGPESNEVARSLGDVAASLYFQGEYAEAEAQVRRALAIEEKVLGPTHVAAAKSRNNLGLLLEAQGKYAEAEAEQRRALALKEAELGPESHEVGTGHSNLATLLRAQGRLAEAETELRTALRVLEKALPSDHPDVDLARVNLAKVLLDLGRPAESLELAEQVWPRRQRDDVAPIERAATAWVMARALWAVDPRAKARARALAERALADFETNGEGSTTNVTEIRDWLAKH